MAHTWELCAQAKKPPGGGQPCRTACSMKMRQNSSFCFCFSSVSLRPPVPGTESSPLSTHMCESHGQTPSSSRMLWAGAQGDRSTMLHLLTVYILSPGMPKAAVPRLPHC